MDPQNKPRPATAAPAGAHARDLGYLDQFLAKLRSQAAAMPAGDARTRLETLLREETDRWREIVALLDSGAGPSPATAPSPAPQSSVATEPPSWQRPNPIARAAPPSRAPSTPTARKPRVTIGSLRGRQK